MRVSFRWRIRTLLLAVLLVGICLGGIGLERRAEMFQRKSQDYGVWEEKLSKVIRILGEEVKRDSDDIVRTESEIRLIPSLDMGRLPKERLRFAHRMRVRSQFIELQEFAGIQKKNYLEAARTPWRLVPEGKPIGPAAEVLRKEFFELGDEP